MKRAAFLALWNWRADSVADLGMRLRAIPSDLPPRGRGRQNEHVETYQMRHLLWTMAHAGSLLSFPCYVEMSDRPDFLLRSAGARIGVELTEATPPNLAQAIAIQEKHYPDRALSASAFAWGTPLMSSDEFHRMFRCHAQPGAGWFGDAAEEEWASLVAGAVRDKLEKLNADGFRREEENWLGVYDNLPQPVWKIDFAVACLKDRVAALQGDGHRFDYVFVERPTSMLIVDRNGSITNVSLSELST